MTEQAIPAHLQHWPGLFEWRDGALMQASAADVAVARSYPSYADKGGLVNGRRLTVMSRSRLYRIAEEVRVIHVVEAVEPGQELYIMGPKPVYGEYLDDALVTQQPPQDVWAPDTYNGPTLPSPAVDYNYEITAYRFDRAGRHTIEWCIGNLHSNRLAIEVEA
ncbi:MAG: hypothetical protein ACWA6Y_01290 [Polaromonas sp.]